MKTGFLLLVIYISQFSWHGMFEKDKKYETEFKLKPSFKDCGRHCRLTARKHITKIAGFVETEFLSYFQEKNIYGLQVEPFVERDEIKNPMDEKYQRFVSILGFDKGVNSGYQTVFIPLFRYCLNDSITFLTVVNEGMYSLSETNLFIYYSNKDSLSCPLMLADDWGDAGYVQTVYSKINDFDRDGQPDIVKISTEYIPDYDSDDLSNGYRVDSMFLYSFNSKYFELKSYSYSRVAATYKNKLSEKKRIKMKWVFMDKNYKYIPEFEEFRIE